MDATSNLVNAVVAATNAAVQTNAPAAKTAAQTSSTSYLPLLIWIVVIGAIFGFLWQRGYLVRMRDYVSETQEELRKCTWPSVDELKGSTVVVMVTILLLGVFTVSVDWILAIVIRNIT
jgi:preprotein translocase SecE subunit